MGNQCKRVCKECNVSKWAGAYYLEPDICSVCVKKINKIIKRKKKCLSCEIVKPIKYPNWICNECKKGVDYDDFSYSQEYSVGF